MFPSKVLREVAIGNLKLGLPLKTIGYSIRYETDIELWGQSEVQLIFNFVQTQGQLVTFHHTRNKDTKAPSRFGRITFKNEREAINLLKRQVVDLEGTSLKLKFSSSNPNSLAIKNPLKLVYQPKVFSLLEEGKEMTDYLKEMVKYPSLPALAPTEEEGTPTDLTLNF